MLRRAGIQTRNLDLRISEHKKIVAKGKSRLGISLIVIIAAKMFFLFAMWELVLKFQVTHVDPAAMQHELLFNPPELLKQHGNF